jgi:hypothetical protein
MMGWNCVGGNCGPEKLYVFNTATGSLTNSVDWGFTNVSLEGANNTGLLIGVRWNSSSSKEEVGVIDTTNGSFTVIGTVGDLMTWQQAILSGNTLYMMGWNCVGGNCGPEKLYVFNTATGSLTNSVDWGFTNVSLEGANNTGLLIGVRWNSSSSKEEVGVIDTTNGSFTVIGTVGDLMTWQQAILSGNTLYMMGWNCVGGNCGPEKLYVFNTATGSLTNSVDWGFTNVQIVTSGNMDEGSTPCTSSTDGVWGACVNGTQTRTVTGYPAGCSGGVTLDATTQTCSSGSGSGSGGGGSSPTPVGYSPAWFIITLISLTLAGGYLMRKKDSTTVY